MGCAGPSSEHREDPRAAPYVQHRLVFEEVWIVYDRGTIRTRAHRVFQHLLVNALWKESLLSAQEQNDVCDAYQNAHRNQHS